MIEATGDLWTYPADFRVITTNGSVRKDGCAVMGRGCAREAALKYPRLARELGARLRTDGNSVHYFEAERLFTFPVKYRWMEFADLELINRSTDDFERALRVVCPACVYVMPRAGCGNGQLDWRNVQPILATLPDNVVVIDDGRGRR